MKTKKHQSVREYISPLLDDILDSLTDVEKAQSRARLTIAARIDDFRKSQGMTKRDLAVKLQRKPSVITKWMSGTHNFTIDTLVEIAVALEVDIKDFQKYYNEEMVVKQEMCLESSRIDPVIVLMTPSQTWRKHRNFQVQLMEETNSFSYSIYEA